MSASFRVATTAEDLVRVMVVRGIVFCEEQQIPYRIERDEFDATAVHVLGEIDGEPVAAGRIRDCGDHAALGRIAVRKGFRGKGVGRELTEFLVATARERGHSSYRLHAQAYLIGFYAQGGFRAVGERFFEAGIEHVLMIRDD
jgi:predicted GNAT family N-acyltransferase